jgi:predicted signal transduction protein with EAL and GGDEF domain
MSFTQSKIFKALLGPALLVFCLMVLHDSFRATAAILLLVLAGCYILFLFTSRTTLLNWVFIAFLVAAFLPIDITFLNYPGPPRFVPLIVGLPNQEDFAREERGEVVLLGCIMRPNEPRWVLVW